MTSGTPATTITCPIFVFADDLSSFDSVEAAVAYIEPWDVDDVTEAFDAVGRRLVVQAEGVERTPRTVGGGRTSIAADRTGAEPLALRAVLLGYVHRVGVERFGLSKADVQAAPLEDLAHIVHLVTRSP